MINKIDLPAAQPDYVKEQIESVLAIPADDALMISAKSGIGVEDVLEAVVRRGSWPVPPIFDLIARLGRVSQAEMDRTFNNGLGMIAVVPPGQADAVLAHLRRLRTPAYLVGEVRKARRGARGVALL